MAEKVYEPEVIQDASLPNTQYQESYDVSTTESDGVSSTSKINDQSVPSRRVATELITTVLNTKSKKVLGEFELAESGGFRIGKYENGESGEVVITPIGIVAKNKNGVTTLSILGEDGSAVFAGEVQAGTLISGAVAVGDGDILIDGEEKRMIFYDPDTGLPAIIIGNV